MILYLALFWKSEFLEFKMAFYLILSGGRWSAYQTCQLLYIYQSALWNVLGSSSS